MNIPKFADAKRLYMTIAVVLIGVAFAVVSFADSPPPIAKDEPTVYPVKAEDFTKIEPKISGDDRLLEVTSPYKISFKIPNDWSIYKYGRVVNSSSSLLLQVRSPQTKLTETGHDYGFVISDGSMIEATVFKNNGYSDVNKYIEKLGPIISSKKLIIVSGQSAVQYELEPELEDESSERLITTFFKGGVQYTFTLIFANNVEKLQSMPAYDTALKTLTVGD